MMAAAASIAAAIQNTNCQLPAMATRASSQPTRRSHGHRESPTRPHQAVDQSEDGRASKQGFIELLSDHFSASESERQLATAVDWGRYGELFDFDPEAEEFLRAP